MNAAQMFNDPRKCYLLWDFEAEYDTGNPAQALAALGAAEKVIAICSFRHRTAPGNLLTSSCPWRRWRNQRAAW